ncbi:MAG TPA: hypothetical protein VF178_08640, partial [Gemmatimonadaceae bacterium]
MAPNPQVHSVAIIAVHGVADQPPLASARSIAGMLLRLRRRTGGPNCEPLQQYTSAKEASIGIPTSPVQVSRRPASESPAWGPDHEFMREQLIDYQSDCEPYETIRIETEKLRTFEGGRQAPAANVHVYEMYWADITRLGTGAVRVFGELYQLLFGLAHLGRQVVQHASLEHPRSRLWEWCRAAHNAAVGALTIWLPLIGLGILATLFVILPGNVPEGAAPVVASVVVGLALFAALWYWTYHRGPRRARSTAGSVAVSTGRMLLRIGVLGSVALATAAGLYVLLASPAGEIWSPRVLALEWIALAFPGLYLISRSLDLRRPGALRVARMLLAGSAVMLVPLVLLGRGNEGMASAALRVFEVQLLVLTVAWIALITAGLISGITLLVAILWRGGSADATNDEAQAARLRTRRAAWTAVATLALSTTSFLVVSLAIFAALYHSSNVLLPETASGTSHPYQPFFVEYFGIAPPDNGAWTQQHFIQEMLVVSASSGFSVLLLILVAVGFTAVWAVLPAVIREVWPARESPGDWDRAATSGKTSEQLGYWLTSGYGIVGMAMVVLFVGTFVVYPAIALTAIADQAYNLNLGPADAVLTWASSSSRSLVSWIGALVAASAIGIFALRGRFDALALGLRPALDVALDVESYLREHPRHRTPRARIAERYASLLRYVTRWRDPDGFPYAGVIIVAHSQGTVITTDLLAFLRREKDPTLRDFTEPDPGVKESGSKRWNWMRAYLFTMGTPLRQLYAACFPHLYAWVHGRPWAWVQYALPKQASRAQRAKFEPRDEGGHVVLDQIAHDATPDPWEVGLTKWVNAYRSGDYVGRALWRTPERSPWLYRRVPDKANYPWPPCPDEPPVVVVSEDATRSRRELCIGSGAHTHYWNATAPEVALEIDLLVEATLANVGEPPFEVPRNGE